VWGFVSGLLKSPEALREGLERMLEEEKNALRGDPNREVKIWLSKLAEVDRKRSAFRDMAAEGHFRNHYTILLTSEYARQIADTIDTFLQRVE
jgi:hypothetical protein